MFQCFSVAVFQACLPGMAVREVAGLPARVRLRVRGRVSAFCVLRSVFFVFCFMESVKFVARGSLFVGRVSVFQCCSVSMFQCFSPACLAQGCGRGQGFRVLRFVFCVS